MGFIVVFLLWSAGPVWAEWANLASLFIVFPSVCGGVIRVLGRLGRAWGV